MFHTIYQHQAQKPAGTGEFWKIIIILAVIIIVGVPILTGGNYIAFGPGPLLIWLVWRSTRNKVESINFYVSENHKGDFEFGYKDSRNKQHGPFPLDEYTYWCYEASPSGKGWNYELYIQINSKHATIYLKEKIVAMVPPPGWTRTPQQIKDGEGVFYLPELANLAAMIDRGAANAPGEATETDEPNEPESVSYDS